MRETCLGDMPEEIQVFLEDYIPRCLPKGRVVYRWFDMALTSKKNGFDYHEVMGLAVVFCQAWNF